MEQFRNALVTKYYRNADGRTINDTICRLNLELRVWFYQWPPGIVLVYDITRRETFEHLENWIREVEQYCTGGLERVKMILIGNKVDLQEERKVRINTEFCKLVVKCKMQM